MIKKKINEATKLRPEGDRLIDATAIKINLPLFIKQIRKEKKWKSSDRNAVTVFKTKGMCIVLIALHKGAIMAKHTASGLTSIEVHKGKMQFKTDYKNIKLCKNQVLVLHRNISHSIVAKKRTFFLLTLTAIIEETSCSE